MDDLTNSSLFKKLRYLKDNYQLIIERLSDIGACSTLKKIKKDCGIKITILDELTALVDDAAGWQSPGMVEKVYRIIRRGSGQDERNAILQIDLVKESSYGSRLIKTLFEMYKGLCNLNGWKTNLLSSSYSKKSLLKSLTFKITGKGIIKYIKHESGYHEAIKDNRHFKVAVTVYPETQKQDIDLKEDEVKTEVYKSSGPGGQSVNTTDSAVRLTHIPSGISASSQNARTQSKNKDMALEVLKAKIVRAEEQRLIKQKKARRDEILFGYSDGTIRTYDYDKGVVYDGRHGKKLGDVDFFTESGIDKLLKEKIKDEEIKKIDSFFLEPKDR